MSGLRFLLEGETHLVQGSAGELYKIQMQCGKVFCSCPSTWRNAGGMRTCKHVKAHIDPACIPAPVQLEKIDWASLPPTTTDSGLYRIVCDPNGRFYIGEAASFKVRQKEHWRKLREGALPCPPRRRRSRWGHSNKHLQADYNLFGAGVFSFHPYRDIDNAADRHVAQILDIRSHLGPDCYNLSEFGGVSRGHKPTEEALANMRAAQGSTEARARNSVAQTGRTHTAETRAKMSANKKGKKAPPKALAKMFGRKVSEKTRAAFDAVRGRSKSPESLAKLRVSIQAYWAGVSVETRAKLYATRRGRKCSAATRERMSDAQKKRKPATAETRAKISATSAGRWTGKKHSEKTRAKMRETWARKKKAAALAPPASVLESKPKK